MRDKDLISICKVYAGGPKIFFYKMMRKKNIVLNGKKAAGKEKLAAGDVVKPFFFLRMIRLINSGYCRCRKQHISKADTTNVVPES